MNEYKNCIFNLAMRVSKNRTLRAIQDGYLLIIPIVVIDSFVLLFLFLPIPAYQTVLKDASFTYVYTALKLIHTSCPAGFFLYRRRYDPHARTAQAAIQKDGGIWALWQGRGRLFMGTHG